MRTCFHIIIITFIIFNSILLTNCEDEKITCHRVIHNKKGSCQGNYCYSQKLNYNKTVYVRKGCIDHVDKKHLNCRKITSDLVVNEELCYCDKKWCNTSSFNNYIFVILFSCFYIFVRT